MRSLHSAKSVRVKLYNGDEIAFIPDGIDGESALAKLREVSDMIRNAEEKYICSELAGTSFSISYVASIHITEPKYISLAEDTTNCWSTKGKFDLLPGEIVVRKEDHSLVYLGVPSDIDYSDSKLYVGNEEQLNEKARPVIAKIKEKYPVIVSNLNKVLGLE